MGLSRLDFLFCYYYNYYFLVEAKIIELFGVIAKTFPIVVSDSAEELFQYVLNRLHSELKSNKKSKLVIAACFSMFRDFFINYAPPVQSFQVAQVYECLKVEDC